MNVKTLALKDTLLVAPEVFGDQRGFFMETWRQDLFTKIGIGPDFVQDNHSLSTKGVLRGLHYQLTQPQGKLIRAIQGEVFDVIVDLRQQSSSFGQWLGVTLSDKNRQMLWVPPGFAHGFLVVSETAEIVYKCTSYYAPEDEHCLLWNDSQLAIDWPLSVEPVVSDKDLAGLPMDRAKFFP